MPNDDVVGVMVMLAILFVVMPLAVMHAMYRAQELCEALRKLADRHRLHFEPGRPLVGQPSVSGSLGGRAFTVRRGAGNNNKAPVRVELALNGSVPPGLELKSKATSLARAAARRRSTVTKSDTAAVDEIMRVKSDDPEALDGYLDRRRRRAAARLIELGGEVDGHRLRVNVNRKQQELEEIDHIVCELVALAPILDVR